MKTQDDIYAQDMRMAKMRLLDAHITRLLNQARGCDNAPAEPVVLLDEPITFDTLLFGGQLGGGMVG